MKKIFTVEEAKKAIIDYFSENEEIFNNCIEELDAWNGCLGDDRYCSMDELDELYNELSPIDILQRAYFGYDAETYTTDKDGSREYGPFNPNREYFTFNGYGNLVSADFKDYSGHLDGYAVDAMARNRCYVNSIDDDGELAALFDDLEAAEAAEAAEADEQ